MRLLVGNCAGSRLLMCMEDLTVAKTIKASISISRHNIVHFHSLDNSNLATPDAILQIHWTNFDDTSITDSGMILTSRGDLEETLHGPPASNL